MKSFPAKLAHERLVSRVDARVRVKGGAAVEGFPALITLVRFFLEKVQKQKEKFYAAWQKLRRTLRRVCDVEEQQWRNTSVSSLVS